MGKKIDREKLDQLVLNQEQRVETLEKRLEYLHQKVMDADVRIAGLEPMCRALAKDAADTVDRDVEFEERVASLERQQFQLLGDMRRLVDTVEQFIRGREDAARCA
jgi:predicted RNase H-like nuclease (RuvC/YqgF family)